MVLANTLLLSQIVGHVILIILSLCIILPLSLNLNDFCGHCLLFAKGEWLESAMLEVHWPSVTYCTFPLFTGVSIFITSIAQIYRYVRLKEEAPFLALFIDVILSIWMLAMSILSAIMVTLGYIVWCDGITQRFRSCEISAGQNIINTDSGKINTSNFYIQMGTAQFGTWGCFAITVGIAVIALLKLINNHQVRNIKASMYLERQRLFNQNYVVSDGRSTPPTSTAESNPKPI